MYRFDPVSNTEIKSVAKTHPFKVLFYYEDQKKPRRRHFRTKAEAEQWLEFAKSWVEVRLPIGVTLDLRHAKPFLARKQTPAGRKMKFCRTLTEAEAWLNSTTI